MTGNDPAAIVGVDENQPVPVLVEEDAFLAYIDYQNIQHNAVEQNTENTNSASISEVPVGICNIVVVEGIVIDVQHCAFEGCLAAFINTWEGVFCEAHELVYGDKCYIHGCEIIKVQDTQACMEHQSDWQQYIQQYSRENFSGICRMLQRPDEENIWQLQGRNNTQLYNKDICW